MSSKRIVTVMLLAFWVLLGPVGMAFSGCAGMDGCDVLCGSISSVESTPSTALAKVPVTAVVIGLDGHLPMPNGNVPDAPPKSPLLPL
jgi:hypothetical protein